METRKEWHCHDFIHAPCHELSRCALDNAAEWNTGVVHEDEPMPSVEAAITSVTMCGSSYVCASNSSRKHARVWLLRVEPPPILALPLSSWLKKLFMDLWLNFWLTQPLKRELNV
eukprot:CAMPEP_0183370648 /NCGR_PEP_ID=MMETSP0164_2-20130417/103075_1 /TAXON_ID=221442 /ORGANISM="Coccolithus pelagicus ssp braarudi, Strain PLY182g" /LENGTH=114 /DNA_ID=CAMNT_0025547095 /DNA_START=179 /DNA_END=520 /DNA_ORIENTATION=-